MREAGETLLTRCDEGDIAYQVGGSGGGDLLLSNGGAEPRHLFAVEPRHLFAVEPA